MKIINFCPYYPPHFGGLEKHAQELHEKLAKSGLHITVFTPHLPSSTKQIENDKNITIIRYPAFEVIHNFPLPKFWSPIFWKLFLQLFKIDFDIVFSITRFFHSPILAFFYAKIKRKRWIHIEHGSDFTRSDSIWVTIIARTYDETIGRLVLILSDMNIAPSQSAARFIAKFTSKPSPVIYRGMPFENIEKISPDMKLKEKFQNKIIITFAGRLISGKGVSYLINAVSKINSNNFIVLIIGDGPEEENLKLIAKNLQLEKKVFFLGRKNFNEVISILKITDIFINPSYNEGLPTTVLEAGTCGCAIIATDVGGTNEIIKDNNSALLIKPYEVDSITKSVELLLKDNEKRNALGSNAKEEIFKKFNWENSRNQYMEKIKELIKK